MSSSSFRSSSSAGSVDLTAAPFLFVYGSHMSPEVLSTLLGRIPMMISDTTLDDYARFAVFRKTFPGIVPRVGCHVKGILLPDLTWDELEMLDLLHSGNGFERQLVSIKTTESIHPMRPTHTYVWTNPETELDLELQDWDFDFYCHHHLKSFLVKTVEPYRHQVDERLSIVTMIVTDIE